MSRNISTSSNIICEKYGYILGRVRHSDVKETVYLNAKNLTIDTEGLKTDRSKLPSTKEMLQKFMEINIWKALKTEQ